MCSKSMRLSCPPLTLNTEIIRLLSVFVKLDDVQDALMVKIDSIGDGMWHALKINYDVSQIVLLFWPRNHEN